MLGFLAGVLPSLLTAAITAYSKSKDVTIAAYQSSVGIAQAQAQAMTAWVGHPLSPPSVMAYGVAIPFFKATAYDNVISYWVTGHAGFTPPFAGGTKEIAMVVVSGMFFSGIAKIWTGK